MNEKKRPEINQCSVLASAVDLRETKQKAKKKKIINSKRNNGSFNELVVFLTVSDGKCWGPLSLNSWAMRTPPLTLLTTWSITSIPMVKIPTFFVSVLIRKNLMSCLVAEKLQEKDIHVDTFVESIYKKTFFLLWISQSFYLFLFSQRSRGTIFAKFKE